MKACISRSLLALLLLLVPLSANAQERRLALVVGNAAYKSGRLPTVASDAALVGEALRTAGFDVTAHRDLDAGRAREAFADFIAKLRISGPGSVAVIYFAGLALQLEGDNYLIPVDANFGQTSDIRRDALLLSGLIRSLSQTEANAAFIILDGARKNPFSISDGPLASGLAWVEPTSHVLVALNAAPGTVAADDKAGSGAYATALTEMLRQGGLSSSDLTRVRLRVAEATNGGQVPWHISGLEDGFVFAERASTVLQRADEPDLARSFQNRPMRTLSAGDAFLAALVRDTFDAYAEFLAEYWRDPMTGRVRALLSARRETLTWRRSVQVNTANAYWTYLERYPRGPHVADARRLLARADDAVVPPSRFARMECDVPAPLPDELDYVERTPLSFADPAFAFEPLRPFPASFLSLPEAAAGAAARDLQDSTAVAVREASLPAVEQTNQARAVPADVEASTDFVPLATVPSLPGAAITKGVGELAMPAASWIPWVTEGLPFQSATSSAEALGTGLPRRRATRSAQSVPFLLGGNPFRARPGEQSSAAKQGMTPSASGRLRPAGASPLPLPRPGERVAPAVRSTMQRVPKPATVGGSTAPMAPLRPSPARQLGGSGGAGSNGSSIRKPVVQAPGGKPDPVRPSN